MKTKSDSVGDTIVATKGFVPRLRVVPDRLWRLQLYGCGLCWSILTSSGWMHWSSWKPYSPPTAAQEAAEGINQKEHEMKYRIRETTPAVDGPLDVWLEVVAGSVVMKARRGVGHAWCIVALNADGKLERHPGIGAELGLKLTDAGRVEFAAL